MNFKIGSIYTRKKNWKLNFKRIKTMRQEEKQILLKDLSARLPYGVKISIPEL